jgi:phosphatidylinositol alpha-1,6-mannosyltransferase
VIPNCVDAAHYVAPREVGDKPWHHVPFTLGIGELKERKGHHLSLRAFCELSTRYADLHHFIVGRRSGDEYERSLMQMAADAGCAERVHLLGNITEDEKIDLLQRARLFVHTPVTAADGGFEGFGIVYLEASACATPVLGTLDCGAEDAIVEGETGLLAAQEPGAVRAAMDRILGDEALAARMGAAGRAHAGAASWDDNARRVLEVYRRALA